MNSKQIQQKSKGSISICRDCVRKIKFNCSVADLSFTTTQEAKVVNCKMYEKMDLNEIESMNEVKKMSEEKKMPVEKFKAGNVEVTLWEQIGKNRTFLNASVHINYMDKEGNWKKGQNFGMNDLPKLALCAWDAFKYMAMTYKAKPVEAPAQPAPIPSVPVQ